MKYFLIVLGVAAVIVVGVVALQRLAMPAGSSPTPSISASATPTRTPTPTSVGATPTPGLIVHEAKGYTVAIQNFAFTPASITVKQGDVITFKNMDQTQHTVTAYATGAFDSGFISPGTQWTLQTANLAPGTYTYHCNIHTTMQGTIIIQSLASAPTPTPTGVTPSPTQTPTPTGVGAQAHTVQMQNHAYVPATLTVSRGDTVIFVGSDAFYSVIVDGRASGRMQPNQPWTLNSGDFPAGTYQIHDAAYLTMRGTLIIE